jgi:hypothetical protein
VNTNQEEQGTMTTDVPTEAIRKLLDYLHEEPEHFAERQRNGEDTSNHIYNHMKVVADWLGDYEPPPDLGAIEIIKAFAAFGVPCVDDHPDYHINDRTNET